MDETKQLPAGLQNLLNQFAAKLTEFQRATRTIQYNYLLILQNINKCDQIIDHIHKSHLHPISHLVDKLNISAGTISGCFKYSIVDRLLQELESLCDVDNNKKIHGKDFKFNYYDSNLPKSISYVQKQHEVRFDRLHVKYIPFLAWFAQFGVKQRCTPINPVKKLVFQLLLGENPDNPSSSMFNHTYSSINSDDYDSFPDDLVPDNVPLSHLKPCAKDVYGTTFIIDPDDPNKPKELIELEKDFNIPSTIKKIKYKDYLKKCVDPNYTEFIDYDKLQQSKEEFDDLVNYVCTRLVGEWLYSVDIDGNGLIYGTDFVLQSGDPHKCRDLKELEQDVDWNPPKTAHIWGWEKFCKSFPNNNPDDRTNSDDNN